MREASTRRGLFAQVPVGSQRLESIAQPVALVAEVSQALLCRREAPLGLPSRSPT